jgi:dephospho-CoA kinase
MLVIGLTGGLASGKSEAARHFASLGAGIVDADEVGHELVAPGSPALAGIVAEFGRDLLRDDGNLDRAALGRTVFSDPAARRRLEALLHPRIRAEMLHRLAKLQTPYAILVAPLLIESGMTDLVDRLLVIDTPEALQRERSRGRDGHDPQHIERILAAQCDRASRLAAADDVICNDQDLAHLHRAVEKLHRRYLDLAKSA